MTARNSDISELVNVLPSLQAPPHQAPHQAPPSRGASRPRDIAPGLALALAVAVLATVTGDHVPLVGSAVPGAVIGAVIAILARPGARLAPGLRFASSFLLQCSVVLLGTQLSIGEAAQVGVASLPVMIGTLVICLGAAWLYGRLLGVPGDLRTLIGVGTGICGGSAIAAISPVIEAASTDVAYAISTIFLFNIAAVIVFPVIGHAIGMSQRAFGLFAGTAVNDTSSVVATATTYGAAAASHAVVVKLVRTLTIIPVSLFLAGRTARKHRAAAEAAGAAAEAAAARVPGSLRMPASRVLRLVPWFLIGFVVAAGLNSAGIIPSASHAPLQRVSVFLVAVALSAIGLSTNVAALRKAGHKPLLLGALLWITVSAASLGLQLLTGTLS